MKKLLRILLITLIISPTVHGQQPDKFSSSTTVIEEVIISAMKRETSLGDTPMSVGVVSGRALADAGAVSVLDYWRQVPSLIVTDQGFGGNRIAIRGLGEEPNGIAESMSAVYFDETPINQSDGLFSMSPDFQLVDINRIEVLRGPQGTLFGASAMGGALRVISNAPDRSQSITELSASTAKVAHGGKAYEVSAVLNRPLGTKSAWRGVVWFDDHAGWIDDRGTGNNDINNVQTTGARLALSAALGQRAEVTTKLQYQQRDRDGFNLVDPVGKPDLGLLTSGDYQVVHLSPEYRDESALLASLSIDYELNWAGLTSITSLSRYDVDLQIDLHEEARYLFFGDYAPVVSVDDIQQDVVVQELRLASNSDTAMPWLVGLYYLDQDTPRTTDFILDDQSLLIFSEDNSRNDTAIFGEITLPLGDAWSATAGARWYDISKRSRSMAGTIESDDQGVIPRLALAWYPADNHMLYTLASRGFRAGGANTPLAVTQCNAAAGYDSDSLWNYEVGARTRWHEGRLTANVTAYHLDWSEAQVEVNLPDCGNIYIVNAGEARSRGIEAELEWAPSPNWHLHMTASRNESEITRAVAGSDIAAGTAIPLVPELTAALSLEHHLRFAGYQGSIAIAFQHVGSTSTSLFAEFDSKQSAYNLVNMRWGLEFPDWHVSVFADNLFDEQASLLCCRFDGGFVSNRPRRVGLRLTYQ